ncbi:hypothetical protein E0L93_11070 [Rubrobacter taiwanensis]|uniref:Uncharacterized protein n=1 Tax=Rubrobacter taiwanensis TaxID=185139 RepID=A0A4R1BFV8_9ACTN|nr:hypothetical protein [Rubrobacter taiwanensis]TCJ16017.1 hypothetical protein E0L93_11070 [Rubrobacter taiwanensis]
MKRHALKLSLPGIILAEAALVWSGVLDLRDAILIVVALEAALLFAVAGELALAFRGYRRARSAGMDGRRAVEEALAAVLPRKLARLAVLELRLMFCLFRWPFQHRKPEEFTYHRSSMMWVLAVMALLVAPVELLAVHLLIPWDWLKIAHLVLGVYAIFWLLAFPASLATLPHRLEPAGLRLRYGVFAEGFIPYAEISSVELARRTALKSGDGLQTQNGSACLAINCKTDVTLRLNEPHRLQGFLRRTEEVEEIHAAVDDPESFVRELRERLSAVTDSRVAGVR